jgi:hypothetical protein
MVDLVYDAVEEMEMPVVDVARKAETLRLAMIGFKKESNSETIAVAALCELTNEVSKAAADVLAKYKSLTVVFALSQTSSPGEVPLSAQ